MTLSVTTPRPYLVDEVAVVAVACCLVLHRFLPRFRGLNFHLGRRFRRILVLAAVVELQRPLEGPFLAIFL